MNDPVRMFTYAIQSSFKDHARLEGVAENLLTFALTTSVNGRILGGYFAAHILSIGPAGWDTASIQQQDSGQGGMPDISIELSLKGARVGYVLVELKLDAGFTTTGGHQVSRYLARSSASGGLSAVVVVARHRATLNALKAALAAQPTSVSPVPVLWQDLCSTLKQLGGSKDLIDALESYAVEAGSVPLPLSADAACLLDQTAAGEFLSHLDFAQSLAQALGHKLQVSANSKSRNFALQGGATSNKSGARYGVVFEPHLDDPRKSPTDICSWGKLPMILVTNAGFAPVQSASDERLRATPTSVEWGQDTAARNALNRSFQGVSLASPPAPNVCFYEASKIIWAAMWQAQLLIHRTVGAKSLRAMLGGGTAANLSDSFGFLDSASQKGLRVCPKDWASSPTLGPMQVYDSGGWNTVPPNAQEASDDYITRILGYL